MLQYMNEWAPVIGTVVAIATLFATILIARNTNRLNRQQHLAQQQREDQRAQEEKRSLYQRQKSEIRDQLLAFKSDTSTWRSQAASSENAPYEPTPNGQKLVVKVEESGHSPEDLLDLLNALSGHSYWLWNPADHRRWIESTSNVQETDEEWLAGYLNSLLDVVKDDVLESTDHKYINDKFWTTLDGDYFSDICEYTSQELKVSDEILKRTISHWTPKEAPEDVKRRIAALANYKAIAEHSLITLLRANLVGNKVHTRSERFFYSMTNIFFELVRNIESKTAEILDSLDQDIENA